MPQVHFKNNKGNSPIIFVILIGLLVIVGVAGGVYYLRSYSTNQRTIRQVNAYSEKRNEINKIILETPEFEDNVNTLEKISKNLNEVKNKWNEVIKMELPEKIKDGYKDCHNEFKDDINNYSESIEMRINIKKGGDTPTDSEISRINNLESNIDFKNSNEICKKAEEEMWKILGEQGINRVQKQ